MRRGKYPVHRREYLVLCYSGLRGAVSLALALMLENDMAVPAVTRDRIIFHMVGAAARAAQWRACVLTAPLLARGAQAGIAAMTLLINGTTTGMVVRKLRLDRDSPAAQRMFRNAVRHITEQTEEGVARLKVCCAPTSAR